MDILVTGFDGYVGNIITEGIKKKYNIFGISNKCQNSKFTLKMDLTDKNEVYLLSKKIKPKIIIHAAGIKDLEYCENNPEIAFNINFKSTINLVNYFSKKSKIIYISTDYVFAGERGDNKETDKPRPKTIYGKSKLAAENYGLYRGDNFIVLRISALYNSKANFIKFIYNNLKNNNVIECFIDVFYSPTFYEDFIKLLERLIIDKSMKNEIFHICGPRLSRFEFAKLFAEILNFNVDLVKPVFNRNKDKFLFKDISLNDRYTINKFKMKKNNIRLNLQKIGDILNNENF